jgi:hypothetical protein
MRKAGTVTFAQVFRDGKPATNVFGGAFCTKILELFVVVPSINQ